MAYRGKGVFFTDVRNTSTDAIFNKESKEPTPAPPKYENLKSWKV